jgi:hypothetical protein
LGHHHNPSDATRIRGASHRGREDLTKHGITPPPWPLAGAEQGVVALA